MRTDAESTGAAPARGRERIFVLLSLGGLAVQAALDPRAHRLWSGAAAVCVFAVAGITARMGSAPARAVAVLAACLAACNQLGWLWQAVMALALAAYALLARFAPSVRPPAGSLVPGLVPGRWIALVGGVTPVALVVWLLLTSPDLSDITSSPLLKLPKVWLFLGAGAFAILNATLEEIIWRGILSPSLAAVWGARAAIAIQGVSFGLQHAHGFPRGVLGVLMAAVWGVMLGILRRHSQGLAAPILAHVVADATIAAIVLARVL